MTPVTPTAPDTATPVTTSTPDPDAPAGPQPPPHILTAPLGLPNTATQPQPWRPATSFCLVRSGKRRRDWPVSSSILSMGDVRFERLGRTQIDYPRVYTSPHHQALLCHSPSSRPIASSPEGSRPAHQTPGHAEDCALGRPPLRCMAKHASVIVSPYADSTATQLAPRLTCHDRAKFLIQADACRLELRPFHCWCRPVTHRHVCLPAELQTGCVDNVDGPFCVLPLLQFVHGDLHGEADSLPVRSLVREI